MSVTPETVALPPQYGLDDDGQAGLVAVPLSVAGERPPGVPLRRRLGEVLIDQDLISPEQLSAALARQSSARSPQPKIGQLVIDLGFATERQVAEALATHLGLDAVDLSRVAPEPEVVRLLPRAIAERTGVLVLERQPNGGLVVATSDPTNVLDLDDVRMCTQAPELFIVVAPKTQITEHLDRAWSMLRANGDTVALIGADLDGVTEADLGDESTDDARIVTLVDRVLSDAARLHASDIHLQRQDDGLRLRYRVDGLLREVTTAPIRLGPAILRRVKRLAGLDLAEPVAPAIRHSRIAVDRTWIDTRVSSLPSLHGEKIVVRLLSRTDDVPALQSLGLEPSQLETVLAAISAPRGVVLIAGPTGSGKSTTLYAAIHQTMTPEKVAVTLEDSILMQVAGVAQVQVSDKSDLTFHRGLRALLQQDPDVILLEAVRAAHTAAFALKTALAGHLVLTSLHTDSAVSAVTQLIQMGVEPSLVASSLTVAVAQRLVRTPCESCRVGYIPDDDTLALLGLRLEDIMDATPLKGVGCPDCRQSGYRGRTAVFEVLEVDQAMRTVLMSSPTEESVAAQARASGQPTLGASALAKAMRGETTFEEVVRLTHSHSSKGPICPSCERGVEHGLKACPWCSAALDAVSCSSCWHPLDPDWMLCPWCGQPPALQGDHAIT